MRENQNPQMSLWTAEGVRELKDLQQIARDCQKGKKKYIRKQYGAMLTCSSRLLLSRQNSLTHTLTKLIIVDALEFEKRNCCSSWWFVDLVVSFLLLCKVPNVGGGGECSDIGVLDGEALGQDCGAKEATKEAEFPEICRIRWG